MTGARRSVVGEPGEGEGVTSTALVRNSYPAFPNQDLEQAMPTKQQADRAGQEEHEGRQLHAVIGEHVLHALGRPGDLQKVEVRWLWKDHYRVNVLVGVVAGSARVAHSYFLVTDSDGNVAESTPRIIRRY
jgi:hypothetical protein